MIKELAFKLLIYTCIFITVFTVAILIFDIIVQGFRGFSFEFLSSAPKDSGRDGGISTIIVSTFLILLVCMLVSVPLSVACAIYIVELSGHYAPLGKYLSRALLTLSAVPSIVFGLFGNLLFCHYLGMGYSIMSGGLTLACMVIPYIAASSEQAIKNVPNEIRTGGYALGLGCYSVIGKLIVPAALPSIFAGIVLAASRALSETAALLFTSGYGTRMPESLMDSGRTVSVHVYELTMNIPGGDKNAYASAFSLILMLFAINVAASEIKKKL